MLHRITEPRRTRAGWPIGLVDQFEHILAYRARRLEGT